MVQTRAQLLVATMHGLLDSDEMTAMRATVFDPLRAAMDTRGGAFVMETVQMALLFAVAQGALMVAVGPVLGGRGGRAASSYVAANMFKGAVLCAMALQRHNWDMMVGMVWGRGPPDESVVLWNAMAYAALDLSALVVNGAMQWRTVLHHVFVVVVAACIAELGPGAAVAQCATLYAFWSGAAAVVNMVMAASKAAQVRGERLSASLFAMTLGIYVVAFACNMASIAIVAWRALGAGELPMHHGVPGALIACVWAYDDAALMRWLAKMSTPAPPKVPDRAEPGSDDEAETDADE